MNSDFIKLSSGVIINMNSIAMIRCSTYVDYDKKKILLGALSSFCSYEYVLRLTTKDLIAITEEDYNFICERMNSN